MSASLADADEVLDDCREAPAQSASPGGGALAGLSLADSEQQFRRLFEAVRDGIMFVDHDSGAIVDANPYFLERVMNSRAC
jgi:PAS domain-containing protein